MPDRIVVRDPLAVLSVYRREVLRMMRREGARVRTSVRQEVPKRSGRLRRNVKLKVGWDSRGPYARITTSARRVTRSVKTRQITSTFRYGLAKQQREHYLQRGLERTPRR